MSGAIKTPSKSAKLKKSQEKPASGQEENIPEAGNLLDITKQSIYDFGIETILNRVLPDVRDGLKPVHRRILWAAYEGGYKNSGYFRKSSRLLGDTLGMYHPHGDISIYDAMVTLTNSQEPLLEGQGNWGSPDDPAAASRYTETKLSQFSHTFLLDPDYVDVVPKSANYDGTLQEPIYLPAKLPMALIMGLSGIATGCSTYMPPFSLASVLNLTKKALKQDTPITADQCMKTLKIKHKYGGVLISNKKDVAKFFETGRGTLAYCPEMEIVKNTIQIQSLTPYQTAPSMREKICDIPEIMRIEETKGFKCKIWLTIEAKKNATAAEMEEILAKIKKRLTVKMGNYAMVTVREDEGNIKFMSVSIPDIINAWMEWRVAFEKKVIERLIEKENEELNRVNSVLWAVDNLELLIQALRDPEDPKAFLVKKGGITAESASYLLDQRLKRFSKMEKKPVLDHRADIKARLKILKHDSQNTSNLKSRILTSL